MHVAVKTLKGLFRDQEYDGKCTVSQGSLRTMALSQLSP